MKKLLVIALSAMMVLAFAAVSMAEATFSGEVDTGLKTYTPNGGDTVSMPYIFGKVNMDGKLGNNVTGKMVIKSNSDPNCFTNPQDPTNENLTNNFQFDEADVTMNEGFGNLKFGYYGWNNNLKDIVDTLRQDVKSDFVSSASIKLGEKLNLGVAYAMPATDTNGDAKGANAAKMGVDLGYNADSYGADLMYTNDSNYLTKATNGNRAYILGVQGWYKVGDFKPFVQYETVPGDAYSGVTKMADAPTNIIVGATYDSAKNPIYARVEYDAAKENAELSNETGIRVGYKLSSGAKIEAQHFENNMKQTNDYLKLICAF
jgi:hypothetical protein